MDNPSTYLDKHCVTTLLDGIVNELVVSAPSDPISFMINGLLREAVARNEEPALLARLHGLKYTLLSDQKDAMAVQSEKETLHAEVEKLKYRIAHLCQTLDTVEKGGVSGPVGVGAPVAAAVAAPPAVGGVPPGHTPFSWGAGIAGVAKHAPALDYAASAAAAASATSLALESFSKRVAVVKVVRSGESAAGSTVSVSGWARTIRMQKELAFVALNDGSCLASLQLVVDKKCFRTAFPA